MLRDAFSDRDVEAVLAHPLAEPGPSTRVLERAGVAHDGELTDAQGGRVWRWRHERAQRASPSTSNSLAGRPIRRIERS